MRVSYTIPDSDLDLTCNALEEVCEGVIEAMVKEIDADPDAFPCCNHCGDFVQYPSPGFPAPGYTPIFLPGRTVHIRNASEIVRGGGGSSIDLACFQAAQRRRREADPYCSVVIDHNEAGDYVALVKNSDQHKDAAKRNLIEPAVEPKEEEHDHNCGCGGHGADTP